MLLLGKYTEEGYAAYQLKDNWLECISILSQS